VYHILLHNFFSSSAYSSCNKIQCFTGSQEIWKLLIYLNHDYDNRVSTIKVLFCMKKVKNFTAEEYFGASQYHLCIALLYPSIRELSWLISPIRGPRQVRDISIQEAQ